MLDRVGTPTYDLAGAGGAGWILLIVALCAVVTCAVAIFRTEVERVAAPVVGGAIVVLLALSGWSALDHMARSNLAAERRSLDARALELTSRAAAPGSALGCLDGLAGESIEEVCEKAVFSSPETTVAAVAYVAAQISLLSAVSDAAAGGVNVGRLQAGLRRAIEADRFGIAAHVLAQREGCTPARCSVFAFVRDPRRLRANLAERRFETIVGNHMLAWPSPSPVAAASTPAPASTASVAPAAKPQSNLYFPSSSSIPPVSIMTAEPGMQEGASEHGRGGSGRSGRQPAVPKGSETAPLSIAPGGR